MLFAMLPALFLIIVHRTAVIDYDLVAEEFFSLHRVEGPFKECIGGCIDITPHKNAKKYDKTKIKIGLQRQLARRLF